MRRLLLKLVCGLAPVTIAACYGAMMDYGTLEAQVIDRDTRAPIPGISVTCRASDGYDAGGAATDSEGKVTITLYDECATVEVVDADGAENGGDYLPVETRFVSSSLKVAMTKR